MQYRRVRGRGARKSWQHFLWEDDGTVGCVGARGVETIPRVAKTQIFENDTTIPHPVFFLVTTTTNNLYLHSTLHWNKKAFPGTISSALKGSRICHSQICLWLMDYFEKLLTQEKLWKQSNYPFIREIYIRKGACTRKRAIIRDQFFPWENYLHGRASFVYQTCSPPPFSWSAPLWGLKPLSLSLASEGL